MDNGVKGRSHPVFIANNQYLCARSYMRRELLTC